VNFTIGRAADAGNDARMAGAGARTGGPRERARTPSGSAAGDAITGVPLTEAARRAAERLAPIRLLDGPDDPRSVEAAQRAQRRPPVAREEAAR
jgi:hypothetical protein